MNTATQAVENPVAALQGEPVLGPLAPLQQYTPLQDQSHQRLGISLQGLYRFFERIDFIRWASESTGSRMLDGYSKSYDDDRGWKYVEPYTRSEALSWANDAFGLVERDEGPITIKNVGLKNMTGYDACDRIRRWLLENGFERMSVCEVLLTDANFEDLRQNVGRANIFWSHIQQENLLGWGGTLSSMRAAQQNHMRLLPPETMFFWLDYTSLRQCQSDFNISVTVMLIKEIGLLIACVDQQLEYTRRSFCVLELFAAVDSSSQLICHSNLLRNDMEHSLAKRPIDTARADSRSREDKGVIDSFIVNSVGFEQLDGIVSKALVGGAWSACFECCCLAQCVRPCLPWWACLRLKSRAHARLGTGSVQAARRRWLCCRLCC
jgi:hypothetical protein